MAKREMVRMTQEEREAIFAKEIIDIYDYSKLFGICYQTASEEMNKLKEKILKNQSFLRCDMAGKLHVQDYLDYYNIPSDRYLTRKEISATEEQVINLLKLMEKTILSNPNIFVNA